MATLTYDPTPSDQPEFNEAEQEALKVGEAAVEEQSRMLAGKFEDAEALEQAYIELQKKLGSKDETEQTDERQLQEGQREQEEVSQPSEIDTVLANASTEYYEKGNLSQETIDKLTSMDSGELVAAYLKAQGEAPKTSDISESDASSIMEVAGGSDAYNNLINWAADNMPADYVQAYDSLIEQGDPRMIKLAVRGLMADYESMMGSEGVMLSGKASQDRPDVFRSQAEVVQAMNDPRYDRDPAYRQDVFAKLERSNLDTY